MGSTAFYYTLSTISQTLAGLFGLLIAVVTYHLGRFKTDIADIETVSKKLEEEITQMQEKEIPELDEYVTTKIDQIKEMSASVSSKNDKLTEMRSTWEQELEIFEKIEPSLDQGQQKMSNERHTQLLAHYGQWKSKREELLPEFNALNALFDEASPAMLQELEKYAPKIKELKKRHSELGSKTKHMHRLANLLNSGLSRSLMCTIWTIVLCLLTLPFVEIICDPRPYRYLAGAWLLGLVGLAVYCLKTYVPLVRTLLEE